MEDGPQNKPVIFSLAPGVQFSTRATGGKTSYVAHHADLGKYFRFGAEEYYVASLIDGVRSVADIHAVLKEDGMRWSPQEIVDFIGQLSQHKIVTADSPPRQTQTAGGDESAPAKPPGVERRALLGGIMSVLSMVISQRIPLFSGQSVAARFESTVGKFFSPSGAVIWLTLVISAMGIVLANLDDFHSELSNLFDPSIWPMLIAIWLSTKVVHEIGHAVAAHRHGVRIGPMGVMFFLFAPLAYVDVTDAWKLRSRFHRLQIALAGVYLELAIAALAAWGWWMLPGGLSGHLAAQVFLIAGPTTLLVNANPLLRLDGYYVISDLLEIPNLRMHGRKQLGGKIEKWLIGIAPSPSLLSGWRRPFATMHAGASIVFQFFWMGGLIIAVSMWARGLGVLLGAAALLLWGLIPLSRWVHKVWTLDQPEKYWLNAKRKRLLWMACCLFGLIQYLSTTTSPLDRRVPVVVRFHNEQISRAAADAFVRTVHVRHGQRVEKGQLLMELDQPELTLEHQSMIDDLSLAHQQSLQNRRNGNIALADAKAHEAASLERRIKEMGQRIDDLQIVAERDGLVTTPKLQRLVGRFVRQGDELIRISDPNEKDIIAAVSEHDMTAYRLAVDSGQQADVRLRGGTHIKAVPTSLRPRARDQLPHPAMSALVGGPLAVRSTGDPDQPVRLAEPQLQSVTPLDPLTSAMVSAGQQGAMTISDNRPLVSRLYDALRPEMK